MTSHSPTAEITNHPRAWFALALILAAEVMDLLDASIVNVAAPVISRELHADSAALQWITGGYSLTFAVFLIAGARLGDRFGRKRLFLVGAWGFVAFSLLCAVAPSTGVLLAGRLLQGIAAALLIPQGFSILFAIFRPSDLGKAFSIFGPVVGLAAVAGPVLGGLLVSMDLFGTSWRLVFLINIPIGVFAAVGATRIFPEARLDVAPRLDWVGMILFGLAAGLIVYPLVQGREAGWPAWTYFMVVGALATLVILAMWTRRRFRQNREPLVRMSIFSHRGFSSGVLITIVFFAGTFGVGLAMTLFLQLGLGFTAVQAGTTAAANALGSSLSALLAGAVLVPRLGRKTLQLGAALQAVGLILVITIVLLQGTQVTGWSLAGPLFIWGVGIGLIIAPLFDFVLASLDEEEIGSGSGVLNTLQQFGTAVGVAILGTIFFSTVGESVTGDPAYVTGFVGTALVGLGFALAVFALVPLLPRMPRDE